MSSIVVQNVQVQCLIDIAEQHFCTSHGESPVAEACPCTDVGTGRMVYGV